MQRLICQFLWAAAMACPDPVWDSLDADMRVQAIHELRRGGFGP